MLSTGIPINGSLIPKLNGFELHTGVELDYSVSSDFYCQGSTTTKPVCQLYGSAQVSGPTPALHLTLTSLSQMPCRLEV